AAYSAVSTVPSELSWYAPGWLTSPTTYAWLALTLATEMSNFVVALGPRFTPEYTRPSRAYNTSRSWSSVRFETNTWPTWVMSMNPSRVTWSVYASFIARVSVSLITSPATTL